MVKQLQFGRCTERCYRECAQAKGLTFLVLDWLPWTSHNICRECARSRRPDLIIRFEHLRDSLAVVK